MNAGESVLYPGQKNQPAVRTKLKSVCFQLHMSGGHIEQQLAEVAASWEKSSAVSS